jgi:hypothetical protein
VIKLEIDFEKIKGINKKYYYRALAEDVVAVIVINHTFKYWRSWIGSVDPKKNHDKEYIKVAKNGNQLDERIAKIIFSYVLSDFPEYNYKS